MSDVPRCFHWNNDGLFLNSLVEPSVNPEGIESLSPGLARFERAYPG